MHIVDEIVFIESKCTTMSQCNFQKQSPVTVFFNNICYMLTKFTRKRFVLVLVLFLKNVFIAQALTF